MVATPIGNLEDMTLRAIRTLKSVQLVAAEDTRRTGILLRHFNIETPILSVHEHNEKGRIERIVSKLAKGESVALVTDAGTPGISDPGAAMVAAVREAGFTVEPIPGANAIVAAVSASGIDSQGFTFLGFPPIRSKDRKLFFQDVVDSSKRRLVVFFEAPHKLEKTLEELNILVKRPIMVARELTKLHEEFVSGLPGELIPKLSSAHGEFTIMVPPAPASDLESVAPDEEEVADMFGRLTEVGGFTSKKDVARATGERLGLTAKQVYEIMERRKLVN